MKGVTRVNMPTAARLAAPPTVAAQRATMQLVSDGLQLLITQAASSQQSVLHCSVSTGLSAHVHCTQEDGTIPSEASLATFTHSGTVLVTGGVVVGNIGGGGVTGVTGPPPMPLLATRPPLAGKPPVEPPTEMPPAPPRGPFGIPVSFVHATAHAQHATTIHQAAFVVMQRAPSILEDVTW